MTDDPNETPEGLEQPPVAPTQYRKRTKPGEVKPAGLARFKLKGLWLLGCGHLSLYWVWRVPEHDGYCARCRAREEYKREFDLGGEG